MSEIKNGIIRKADLSMSDHGVLTLVLAVEGDGWMTVLGGHTLGHGFLGAKTFQGSPKGIEEIMRIMDVIGVARFSDLNGKHIRVVLEGWGDPVHKFGNIIEDKWFDYREFYKKEGEADEKA